MFDRVVCINLERRPERYKTFRARLPGDWPFRPVERVVAVDGEQADLPAWYGGEFRPKLKGAWGCLQSHLGIWQSAVDANLSSVLVLEDDAVCCNAFTPMVKKFLDHVPDDWNQIYLGGQHLCTDSKPPVIVNDRVIRARNVNRTHAYAISRNPMEACIQKFANPWHGKGLKGWHVDHQLGYLHQLGRWNVYCPSKWLVGQAAGTSDTFESRMMRTCWWNEFGIAKPEAVPC